MTTLNRRRDAPNDLVAAPRQLADRHVRLRCPAWGALAIDYALPWYALPPILAAAFLA